MARSALLIVSLFFTASLGAGLVYNESSNRSEISDLEDQIDQIEDLWSDANMTSDGISEENLLLLEAKENLESDIESLSALIEQAAQRRVVLEANITALNVQIEQLNQTIATSQGDIDQLESQRALLDQEVSLLEVDLLLSESQIEDLQASYQTLQSTLSALQATISRPIFQLVHKWESCPDSLPGHEFQLGFDDGTGSEDIDGRIAGDEITHREGVCNGPIGMVKDINPVGDAAPRNPVVMGGVAYFAADDGVHGEELWRSDGTVSGTYMVKDVNPEERWINIIQGTTEPDDSDITELTVAGDKLFFFARNNSQLPFTDHELWVSDGTASGTKQVIEDGMFFQTLSQSVPFVGQNIAWYTGPRELTAVGDKVFFSSMAAYWYSYEDWEMSGEELWVSDGTELGTMIVENIHPDTESGQAQGINVCCADWAGSSPRELTVAGDSLYFTADNGQDGRELWKVDTDVSFFNYDAVRVRDINPGASGSNAASLTAAGDRLYFSANDGVNGDELWTTMGTTATTVMVDDLNTSGSSSPDRLVWADGSLWFAANVDSDSGMELLKLTEVAVASGYDATISYISNDTVDPRPLSPLGAYMYIREASDNTVHRWSDGDNTLTKIRIGTPRIFGTSTPDQQDLIMPSDSHLSVLISKDAMLDGTYLEERFSEDSYEALYITMFVSDVHFTINGKVMIAEITPEGDIFPLGFGSSTSDQPFERNGQPWGGCQYLIDVGVTYSDVFDCATPRSVSFTMPFVALDQHILMSASHVAHGTELTSLYLPHKYGYEEGSDENLCPMGPYVESCGPDFIDWLI
jgi:ELWxxDGT repeat protein